MFVMSTGTVKFFNEAKGFGFITPEDGGNDIFVHVTGVLEGQLNENDKVEYEIGEGQKGPCAVQVRKV
jgi:cold shock protein